MATALVILPILLIVLFGLVSMTMRGSALSARMIRQDQTFYMAESGLKIGYQLFSYNNFWGYTHDLDGDPIPTSEDNHLLVDPDLGWNLASDGWYVWSSEGSDESFTQSSLEEMLRIRIEPLPSEREERQFYVPTGYNSVDGSLNYDTRTHEVMRERWRITCQASLGGEQVTHVQEGEIILPGEKVIFDNGSHSSFSRSVSQKVIGDLHVNGDLYLTPWATNGYSLKLKDLLSKFSIGPDWLRERSVVDPRSGLTMPNSAMLMLLSRGLIDKGATIILENRSSPGSFKLDKNTAGLLAKFLSEPAPISVDAFLSRELPPGMPIPMREAIADDFERTSDALGRGDKVNLTLPIIHASDRPELEIIANNISSGKKIIRRHDYWDRPDGPADSTSTTKTKVMINGVEMNGLDGSYGSFTLPFPDTTKMTEGGVLDSYSPNWSDPDTGARAKFDNKVRDNDLGQRRIQTPTRKSMMPGGYFDKKAKLRISNASVSASWAQEKSFYQQSELREETVIEVDLQQLQASSDWPVNNIIYAKKPVRFVNGHKLDRPLTFVSAHTVYIKGDFNNTDSTGGADLSKLPSATIMTTDKVYRLTNSFDDTAASTFKQSLLSKPSLEGYHDEFPLERTLGSLFLKYMPLDKNHRVADDVLRFGKNFRTVHNAEDPNKENPSPEDYFLDINAVIAEGAPESDNHLWDYIAKKNQLPGPADLEGEDYVGELIENMKFDPRMKILGKEGLLKIFPDSERDFEASSMGYEEAGFGDGIPMAAFPSSEPYLENLAMMTIRETGSQVFLRNSILDRTSNNRESDIPGVTAQKRRSAYIPPAPTKIPGNPLHGSSDHADYTLATNPSVAGIDLTTGEIATGAVPIRGALKKRWYSL